MSSRLTDCFVVRTNGHGEKATYAKHAYRAGDLVYFVRGEVQGERTRMTIEIGPGEHVYDSYAESINHSFSPNLEVRGREMVAILDIAVGDELTFDYLKSETEIAAPFGCNKTGRSVCSERGGDRPGEA